jgi:carboxypeptidase C (cathepsin A)
LSRIPYPSGTKDTDRGFPKTSVLGKDRSTEYFFEGGEDPRRNGIDLAGNGGPGGVSVAPSAEGGGQ